MSRRLVALLPILLAVTALAQEPVPLAAFGGQWSFSGGPRERQELSEAIDGVVAQMNVLIREFARGQIHDRVPVDERVHITPRGSGFALVLGDWGPIEVPLDGSYRDVADPEDGTVRVSATFRDGRITEHQVTSQGRRTNTFVLDDGNRRLTLWVRIHSDQLPADIVYHLSYRQRGAGDPSQR